MVAALEDLPRGLAGLLDGAGGEPRWPRSPVRVYRLLVELTETSRRLGGHRSAFSAYTPKRNAGSTCWVEGVTGGHVHAWARGHGFPSAAGAAGAGRPPIEVRRIRQTVIERDRRPVSHTPATMHAGDRCHAAGPGDPPGHEPAPALRQLAGGVEELQQGTELSFPASGGKRPARWPASSWRPARIRSRARRTSDRNAVVISCHAWSS